MKLRFFFFLYSEQYDCEKVTNNVLLITIQESERNIK